MLRIIIVVCDRKKTFLFSNIMIQKHDGITVAVHKMASWSHLQRVFLPFSSSLLWTMLFCTFKMDCISSVTRRTQMLLTVNMFHLISSCGNLILISWRFILPNLESFSAVRLQKQHLGSCPTSSTRRSCMNKRKMHCLFGAVLTKFLCIPFCISGYAAVFRQCSLLLLRSIIMFFLYEQDALILTISCFTSIVKFCLRIQKECDGYSHVTSLKYSYLCFYIMSSLGDSCVKK